MNYSSRFWLFAPLTMFLALAAWAMGYWWVVAGAFDKKLDALNRQPAMPGINIRYASKTISGFPFNIDVVFTGFRIEGTAAHGPFAWQSEHFALHALTYGRTQHIYEAAGRQVLDWTDGRGAEHHVEFLPASLRASAIADDKGLVRFDLDAVGLGGSDSDGAPLTIGRAQFHLRRDPKADALDLAASADDAKTADFQVRHLEALATLSHRAALAPLLAGAQSWPDASAAWRQAGGDESAPTGAGADAADPVLNSLF